MKNLFKLLCIVWIVVIAISCTSDNFEDYYEMLDCETANISFSSDIKPIIDTNCAVSGCHVTGTGLPSWETYANISANAGKIASRTAAGEMPPSISGKSLTIEQVQKIQCWVGSGAPNN